MWEYNYGDELYHFGVPGMKWGHRKANVQVSSAKAAYKSSKAAYKTAKKDLRKGAGISGFGYAGISGISKYNNNKTKMNKAEMNMIDAKAKYKASKAKTSEKAAKAEFKTYRKEMQKSGLAGSVVDQQSGGRSTKLYNHLKTQKGKAYADKIEKKVQNVAVTEFCVAATVAVGSTVAQAILMNRDY